MLAKADKSTAFDPAEFIKPREEKRNELLLMIKTEAGKKKKQGGWGTISKRVFSKPPRLSHERASAVRRAGLSRRKQTGLFL